MKLLGKNSKSILHLWIKLRIYGNPSQMEMQHTRKENSRRNKKSLRKKRPWKKRKSRGRRQYCKQRSKRI
jgi:hypothetical protein